MRLSGRCIHDGRPLTIEVAGGKVTALHWLPELEGGTGGRLPRDVWLLPGLFDLQVNGYGGHDFNGPEASVEGVAQAVRALWRAGVTRCCPTVTTASASAMAASMATLAQACADPLVEASIACIHIEGPYIAAEDGPRGAHPREHVRAPDRDEFRRWQELSGERIGLLTLAPEVPGGLAFIEWLAEQGVVVALGHTGASPELIRDAIAAGARLSTHLGNAAHALLPRHVNYVWEQAAADELWASLIMDGYHLPPSVARCLVRCKGVERTILISDAIVLAGQPPGLYRLPHAEVEVTSDHRCLLVGTPFLAGSVSPLTHGMENAVRFAGVTPAEAVRMVTHNPVQLLAGSLPPEGLRVGQIAWLTVGRWQPGTGPMEVLATVVAGQLVHHTLEAVRLGLVEED